MIALPVFTLAQEVRQNGQSHFTVTVEDPLHGHSYQHGHLAKYGFKPQTQHKNTKNKGILHASEHLSFNREKDIKMLRNSMNALPTESLKACCYRYPGNS